MKTYTLQHGACPYVYQGPAMRHLNAFKPGLYFIVHPATSPTANQPVTAPLPFYFANRIFYLKAGKRKRKYDNC